MVDALRNQVVRALKGCADSLCAKEFEDAPLRLLQREIQPALRDREDSSLRTVAFLLDAWVDDFYFNLATDVPSKVSEEFDTLRTQFLC